MVLKLYIIWFPAVHVIYNEIKQDDKEHYIYLLLLVSLAIQLFVQLFLLLNNDNLSNIKIIIFVDIFMIVAVYMALH